MVSGDEPCVYMEFTGDKGSSIERRFHRNGDGELVVHHELYQAGRTGGSLAKAVTRGSFEEYERLGVKQVDTYADLDVGRYAWARYGFRATTDNRAYLRRAVTEANQYGRISGDARDKLLEAIDRDGDADTAVWRMADTIGTDPETLQAKAVYERARKDNPDSPEVKALYKEYDDLAKVGKIVMARQSFGWHAKIRLDDKVAMARLRAYVAPKPTAAPKSAPRIEPRRTRTDEQVAQYNAELTAKRAGRVISSRTDKQIAQDKSDQIANRIRLGLPVAHLKPRAAEADESKPKQGSDMFYVLPDGTREDKDLWAVMLGDDDIILPQTEADL